MDNADKEKKLMERLTERTALGIVGNNNKVKNYPLYKIAEYDELDYGIVGQCFNKLADYEDAEEQGLLLRLPCKVGDTVYEIQPLTNRITERIIKSIVICNAPNLAIMYKSGYDYSILHEDFDKTIFLTKEEAEQALRQMGG